MAEYKGNLKNFNKYFGDYCRNKVNFLTREFRKQSVDNNCQYCGEVRILESAHRNGRERVLIIKDILNSYFIEDDYYTVDMDKFEKLFIKAHQPLQEHFWFLCKDCHKKYDGGQINDEEIKSVQINIIEKYLEKLTNIVDTKEINEKKINEYNIKNKLTEDYSNLSKVEKGLKSSGKQFAKKYFNDVKTNLGLLTTDQIFKDNYIRKIFINEKCDKYIDGTRTRINAVIRLAKKYKYEEIIKFIK